MKRVRQSVVGLTRDPKGENTLWGNTNFSKSSLCDHLYLKIGEDRPWQKVMPKEL